MSEVPSAELTISYRLTDVLERMEERLGRIEGKLDGKADRADLNVLSAELEKVRGDVSDIKLWRAKVIGIAAGVGAVFGGAAATVAQALGG